MQREYMPYVLVSTFQATFLMVMMRKEPREAFWSIDFPAKTMTKQPPSIELEHLALKDRTIGLLTISLSKWWYVDVYVSMYSYGGIFLCIFS